MANEQINRLVFSSAAINSLALPEFPKVPAILKSGRPDYAAAWVQYEASCEQWRQQAQHIIQQALQAIKSSSAS